MPTTTLEDELIVAMRRADSSETHFTLPTPAQREALMQTTGVDVRLAGRVMSIPASRIERWNRSEDPWQEYRGTGDDWPGEIYRAFLVALQALAVKAAQVQEARAQSLLDEQRRDALERLADSELEAQAAYSHAPSANPYKPDETIED